MRVHPNVLALCPIEGWMMPLRWSVDQLMPMTSMATLNTEREERAQLCRTSDTHTHTDDTHTGAQDWTGLEGKLVTGTATNYGCHLTCPVDVIGICLPLHHFKVSKLLLFMSPLIFWERLYTHTWAAIDWQIDSRSLFERSMSIDHLVVTWSDQVVAFSSSFSDSFV